MRVRLTHAMQEAVTRRVSEDLAHAVVERRVTYGRTQHEITLPAIAWRRILDEMMRQCYGPAGGKLKAKGRPSESAYLAIGRIAECVKKIEGHPGLRESAAVGTVGDVLPCWVLEDAAGVLYRPYPQPAPAEFALLVPQHVEVHGRTVTIWVRASTAQRELLEAQCDAYRHDLHLVLAGPLAAA